MANDKNVTFGELEGRIFKEIVEIDNNYNKHHQIKRMVP